jgi:hypothetical protein
LQVFPPEIATRLRDSLQHTPVAAGSRLMDGGPAAAIGQIGIGPTFEERECPAPADHLIEQRTIAAPRCVEIHRTAHRQPQLLELRSTACRQDTLWPARDRWAAPQRFAQLRDVISPDKFDRSIHGFKYIAKLKKSLARFSHQISSCGCAMR